MLNHIDPNDFPGLHEWLDRHPTLARMDEKELLLLLLYKLDTEQRSLNEIRSNTKTHWTPEHHYQKEQ